MNIEIASAATDNKAKYGFEGCSTCNSSSMSIISADGTTRSKVTTSTDNYATVGNFIMAPIQVSTSNIEKKLDL